MKSLSTSIAVTALSLTGHLATPKRAAAAVVYSTGFESPGMASGSQLVGQDGWVVGAPFLSPNAPVITNAVAQSGTQSVRVRGQDMVHANEVGPELDAVGSYRKPVSFDSAAAGLPFVTVTANVRLDGPVALGDFFSANLAARTGDGGNGEISISSDGVVYGYGDTGNILFSTPVTLGAWHILGVNVNFTANLYSFTVDAASFGPYLFDTGITSDVLARGSMVTYAKPDAGANLRSNYTAYFDNFSINAVPEPATTGFLLFGACGLLMRRRPARIKIKAWTL